MSAWTTKEDIRAAVQKLWERGTLARFAWTGQGLELPYRIALKGPTSSQWSERFDEARKWITSLEGLPLEWREFNHPRLGRNQVPVAAKWSTADELLGFLRKKEEAARFVALAQSLACRFSKLTPWIEAHPLLVLSEAATWPRLLEVAAWIQARPRPGVYLRQIDVPGVHTKFVESHRAVLSQWLDLILAPEAINTAATGLAGFSARYGFLDKPRLVRFRHLDPRIAGPRDLTWPVADWARWETPPRRVFIVENEVTYLAFPAVDNSWAVFGAGYGFEGWQEVSWLANAEIWYWGDLDTHGLAILDQLRGVAPHSRSLLMDEATLVRHRDFWTTETHPTDRVLNRLTSEEQRLYQQLVTDTWSPRLRLEQEHIPFSWLEKNLPR